jgi:UDPglucose 6-dehydrogenase
MKIAVIGTGYVGLVTGTCFSEVGMHVTCVDVDEEKVEKLRKGISPIYEPGLEEMLKRNILKNRIFFTTSLAEGIKEAEVIFIAVGTPSDKDGSADLRFVLQVASEIGKNLNHPAVITTKSTVPVGTSVKVKHAIQHELDKRNANIRFHIASNPEFLKEGAAIEDFMKPDRIVIGVENKDAEEILRKLYHPFVLNGHPILVMDIPSAELTKYAANAMLATKISFMNDMANLCELLGADINMVRKGIGSDPRIGQRFIYPGIGYGGSCFPKDVKAIIKTASEHGYRLRILESVDAVNNDQKKVLAKKILHYHNGDIKNKIFALWGLSFKPKTDDMREAPSLDIIKVLTDAGASIRAYDPVAMHEAEKILKTNSKVIFCNDMMDALNKADGLIVATEWPEFRLPDWNEISALMNKKVVFDGRNIYERKDLEALGFDYICMGSNPKKNN